MIPVKVLNEREIARAIFLKRSEFRRGISEKAFKKILHYGVTNLDHFLDVDDHYDSEYYAMYKARFNPPMQLSASMDALELADGTTGPPPGEEVEVLIKAFNAPVETEKVIHEMAILSNLWSLGHPNIIRPFIADATSFFIMEGNELLGLVFEHIEGKSYSDLLKMNTNTGEDHHNHHHESHHTNMLTWTLFDRIWILLQIIDTLYLLDFVYGMRDQVIDFQSIIFEGKTPVLMDCGRKDGATTASNPTRSHNVTITGFWQLYESIFHANTFYAHTAANTVPLPEPFNSWLSRPLSRPNSVRALAVDVKDYLPIGSLLMTNFKVSTGKAASTGSDFYGAGEDANEGGHHKIKTIKFEEIGCDCIEDIYQLRAIRQKFQKKVESLFEK